MKPGARAVFEAALLERAKRQNKSRVVGLVLGIHESTIVTMTVHADGSYTVVDEKVSR